VAIAAALQIRLTLKGAINPSVSRAASIDAYNLYLLGRYHFQKRTVFELEEAQRYFDNAIERDPGYAPAYNGLADSILFQSDAAYGAVPVEQSIAAALPLIEKSLELNPLLAETHASLGLLRMFEWDLLASEAALKRATELNPNLSQAFVWLYVTYERAVQPRNAFETLQRAFALDPLSPIVNTNMAAELWIRSRTHDALQAANRIIQSAPDGPLGFRRTGRIKWTSGELAEAVSWYRQSIELAPEDRNSKLELGALLVDLGVYDEAESLLDDQRYIAYLAQGRVEEALAIVRTSLEARPEHLSTIFAAAHTEARAGNYDRVRLLLEPIAEGAETGEGSLFLRSGIHFWDPQIAAMDLAVALLETSDREAGLALLAEVKAYFAFLRAEGLEHPMLRFQEARILALEGRQDEALEALRQIIAAGWRFWYMDGDPALENLWERKEFHSIINDRNMFIEQDRAKLENS
jgi:tetratricopeptide (TPR) repeat protein